MKIVNRIIEVLEKADNGIADDLFVLTSLYSDYAPGDPRNGGRMAAIRKAVYNNPRLIFCSSDSRRIALL